jgi:hypothetical protein
LAEKDGLQVAIKETLTRFRTALKGSTRFYFYFYKIYFLAAQDESKLLSDLKHKNVVRLY